MSKKYTTEHINFLKQNAKGKFNSDLIDMFYKKFNILLTVNRISQLKSYYGIKSGLTNGYGSFKYTTEHVKFLKQHSYGINTKELTNKFNKAFSLNKTQSAIRAFKKDHNLKNGLDTTFKKGNISHNKKNIGSERLTKDGYILIKTAEPNIWSLKHRVIYEKAHGKIPCNCKLIFADQNKFNLSLNNLIVINNSTELIMNRRGLFCNYSGLTKTGINVAKLMSLTSKKCIKN